MNIFTKSKQIIMVVARYNENLDWLKNVSWNYVVYNKGGDLPKWIKNEIKLQENIGRETYIYLTYIIDNYDNLPDYIVFTQANPFDHAQGLMKKINDFDGKDDFYPLSDVVCHVWIDKNGIPSEMGLELAEAVRNLFLDDVKSFENFDYPEGAEFIVSKKMILFHTKKTYQKILNSIIQAELIDDKTVGYTISSAKFPQVRKRLFRKKMTLREIIKSMTNEENKINEGIGIFGIFSPWVMELLWKTLFDNKHKTVYD